MNEATAWHLVFLRMFVSVVILKLGVFSFASLSFSYSVHIAPSLFVCVSQPSLALRVPLNRVLRLAARPSHARTPGALGASFGLSTCICLSHSPLRSTASWESRPDRFR